MLAGALVMLVQSWIFGEDWSAFASASGRSWAALGYLVVFGSLIAFTSFAYCLNELPASTVGTYAYVNPVVAVFLGHVVLRRAAVAVPARRRAADRGRRGAHHPAQGDAGDGRRCPTASPAGAAD